MDHLMKLVTTALQWSYAKAEEDVRPEHLEAAADQLTLRRDKIHVVDAEQAKKEGESWKQASLEEPGESETKAKKGENEAGKSAHWRNLSPTIRNESEPSAQFFWAESSDKRVSAQYLRPNIQPIYEGISQLGISLPQMS